MTEKHDAHTDSDTTAGSGDFPAQLRDMTHWHREPEGRTRQRWTLGSVTKLRPGDVIDQGPGTGRMVLLNFHYSIPKTDPQRNNLRGLRVWDVEKGVETALTLLVTAHIRVSDTDGYAKTGADR